MKLSQNFSYLRQLVKVFGAQMGSHSQDLRLEPVDGLKLPQWPKVKVIGRYVYQLRESQPKL